MKKLFSILCLGIFLVSNAQKLEKTEEIAEGISKLDFKTFQLFTLKDNQGERQMPNSLFYGTQHKDLVEKASPKGSVAGSVHSFLVEMQGETLLFDAGLGGSGRLWEHLSTLKIKADEVKHIFLTHMHFDHIGGLIKDEKAVFPNATLYIAQAEYGHWKKSRNAFALQVLSLYKEKLKVFSYAEEFLSVKPIEAHGHTPGHTAFQLGNLLIAGDFMHGLDLQKKYPQVSASYDMNPEQAVKSRQKLWDYAKKNCLVIAGMHLPKNGLYEFEK